MHACNKTIEKSKEMIITKVKIMVISKRRERVMLRKVTRGAFGGAGNVPFLDLVDHIEVLK